MNDLKDAKKIYDEIEIPEELSVRVQEAIKQSAKKHEQDEKIIQIRRGSNVMKKFAGAAAAVMLTFVAGLNTSTTFAQEMSEIPVLGAIARVLTFQSYEKEEEDVKISVEIPTIEMIAEDTNGLADSINQEILSLCQKYADEEMQSAKDYREAFLATGGTKEEWEAHKIAIRVWYEIKNETEDYLSFAVMGSNNWNGVGAEARYYNLDLKNQKLVTLKDLLGDDYLDIVNGSIKSQMEEKTAQGEIEFFTAEEGGFAGISENQKFYINEAGNPVIVFEKYEIAPGAYGAVEFEVAK